MVKRPAMLHGFVYWALKKQHINKIEVTEMKKLVIKNEKIQHKLEVVFIEDKMSETCVRWFYHVQWTPQI